MPNVISAYPPGQSTTFADSGVGTYVPNNTAQQQLAALMAAEAAQKKPAASRGGGSGASGVHYENQQQAAPARQAAPTQGYRRPIWLVPQHGPSWGGGAYVRSYEYTPYAVFGGYETMSANPNTGMVTDMTGTGGQPLGGK